MNLRTWVAAIALGAVACGAKAPPPAKEISSKAPPRAADKQALPPAASPFRVEIGPVRSDGASVEGVIRDAAANEPLAGATIVLASSALPGEDAQVTDIHGRFISQPLPEGRYTLTVYYADLTAKTQLDVRPKQTLKVALDWSLKPGGGDVVGIVAAAPEKFATAAAALAKGEVEQAYQLATAELAKQPSSRLHAIRAVARYASAIEAFNRDATHGEIKDLRAGAVRFLADLDEVQHHIAAAATDPQFALELCVACMNAEDGYLRAGPPGILDVERDAAGKDLPDHDPRRRPTYRFDAGDLAWAHAMLSFQQAAINIALAYDWQWLEGLDHGDPSPTVTVKLVEPARIAKAKELILAGLAASDDARKAYLAETDDDREWVPNPKQKNYTSPLPVDAKLYKTWEQIIGDVRGLVTGETGISLAELWKVFKVKTKGPAGYLNVSAMLTTPKEIVFEKDAFDRIEAEHNVTKQNALVTKLLQSVLGDGYKAKMKPSPLTARLIEVRVALDKGGTLVEDKLKYLLWLN